MRFTRPLARLSAALGPGVLAVGFAALALASWRRWPDLLVDFGREVYAAWQIAEGAALFRDVAYFNGPASPLFNALVLRIGGTSLTSLFVVNLVFLALFVGLVYVRLVGLCGRVGATLAGLALMVLFGFGHLIEIGNYNYIAPYSHECVHGLYLSFVMMVLLLAPRATEEVSVERPGWTMAATAGLAWGLVFLGKPEMFLAATGAAITVFAAQVYSRQDTCKGVLCRAVCFATSGAAVAGLFLAALATRMPSADALGAVAGAWRWIAASEIAHQHFYRNSAGMLDPGAGLGRVATSAAAVALVVAAVRYGDVWLVQRRTPRPLIAAALCLALSLALRPQLFPALLDPGALPIVSMVLAVAFTVALVRDRRRADFAVEGLAWSVFGLLLLPKILLAPRFGHYGFVLAMPVTVLAVACLVGVRDQQRSRWFGPAARWALVAIVLIDLGLYAQRSSGLWHRKQLAVGQGGDAIVGYSSRSRPLETAIGELIDHVAVEVPPEGTLAVLPEGVMVNYLTRRRNSTPYVVLMPPEMLMFGEHSIHESYRRHPPDYIALVHKDTSEYGLDYFGRGTYGVETRRWVDEHYTVIHTIGAPPLVGPEFGIQLLRRDRD